MASLLSRTAVRRDVELIPGDMIAVTARRLAVKPPREQA
jgi:hypothetical protein